MSRVNILKLHGLVHKARHFSDELLMHFRQKPPSPVKVVDIDFENGTVEFDQKPQGEVTANFRYEEDD